MWCMVCVCLKRFWPTFLLSRVIDQNSFLQFTVMRWNQIIRTLHNALNRMENQCIKLFSILITSQIIPFQNSPSPKSPFFWQVRPRQALKQGITGGQWAFRQAIDKVDFILRQIFSKHWTIWQILEHWSLHACICLGLKCTQKCTSKCVSSIMIIIMIC